MKECDFTSIVGIIAEFNPFHNGHKYLIDTVRGLSADAVVCSMSGNFVQRGDVAFISKFARAESALKCGIDLCLELPVPYSLSSAPGFALGGVASLLAAGVDTIAFGSECGDTNKLTRIADCLLSRKFSTKLSDELKSGISFPAARQRAVAAVIGDEFASVLENPNDNLGIEYISAAKNLGAAIDFIAIKRTGAEHDAICPSGKFASASFIRNAVRGSTCSVKEFMPEPSLEILTRELAAGRISDIKRLEGAILAILRSKSYGEYKTLPDLSEGIENRIYNAVQGAVDYESLLADIKVKRYTLARIKRLVLSAFLNIDGSFFTSAPPYVRALGYTAEGGEILKTGFKKIPLVCRYSDVYALGADAEKLFETECRATDLFELSLIKPGRCGSDKSFKIIKG